MRKLTLSALGALSSCLIALPVTAQQADSNLALPEAKPGECFAKVITPAQFESRSEQVVVQEASQRIETVEAVYETVVEPITLQEASQALTVTPAKFSNKTEQVVVQDAELIWTSQRGKTTQPANPGALEQIARSGIDIEAVEPNSCFIEYYTEAQYKTEEQKVLVKEASETIEIIPAVFETIEQQVEVKQASSEVVDVPAIYRTVTESVLVEPARSKWQTDCGGVVEQLANATGEVMCLVEVPARYETLTKTVLDKPATTKTVNIPAEFKTFSIQKLVTPATEKRVKVPAKYEVIAKQVKVSEAEFFWLPKGETADANAAATGREICLTERPAETVNIITQVLSEPASTTTTSVEEKVENVQIQRLVSPATERRIDVPERTETVTQQVEIVPSSVEWKPVLCRVNMTREIITSLQQALQSEGYDPGPIDGFMGQGTLRAVERYQADQGLDRGGITLELLKQLKVEAS